MSGVNLSGFRAHHKPFARHAADNDYLTVLGEGGGLRLFLRCQRTTLCDQVVYDDVQTSNTHGYVFAPHYGTGQRVPKLYDAVETGREELSQRGMRTQGPQLVGMSHDGRAEAHRQRTDQNAISSGSDEQLRSAALRHGANATQMFSHLYSNKFTQRYGSISRKSIERHEKHRGIRVSCRISGEIIIS